MNRIRSSRYIVTHLFVTCSYGVPMILVMGLLALLPGCGTGTSSNNQLKAPPPPAIPSAVPFLSEPLVPDAAAPGGADFTLTVNGTGFVSGSTVNWNGSVRTTHFVSSTQLTAGISASDIAAAGTASVTVTNPKPGGGSSNAALFPVANTSSVALNTSVAVQAGDGPRSVAVGDFNNDGKLDLVVSNTGVGDVSVLLGKGDGSFQPAVNYALGSGALSQALEATVADLDRDGKLDLVFSDSYDNNVVVLLGKGDGTFQPAVKYTAQANPTSVAVADLRGNGKLDLIVSNQNCPSGPPCPSGSVSILLGNGDGTFQTHVDYPAGVDANWVTVGDFNGDGKLDLAVANGQGSCPGCQSGFSILLGKGDGSFQPPQTYYGGINEATIATADFNGDGKLDLVLIDNIGIAWFFLGNGDGTFQINNPGSYIVDSFPWGSVGIGDFNGDGKLDFVVSISNGNPVLHYVAVFLGNGDGTFQSALKFDTGIYPQGVAVGDFNQDGRLDLAVPNHSDNTVSVMLQ